MDDGVLAVCEQALKTFEGAGAIVEPLSLGFDAEAVWRAWLLWRRALTAPGVAAALAQPGATRDQVKPEALPGNWTSRRPDERRLHAGRRGAQRLLPAMAGPEASTCWPCVG